MAIRGPDAKVWKQQHLAPWQILQADLLPASKLCLGLLHGLAADWLSGLPRASGSQSWLSFDSEDFTHFYSFVKKGPSKCFMKPTLENINGSNFAFEKAEDMVGRVLLCMIEGKVADEDVYVGRTYKDAPNVDGYIFINTDEELMTGDIVKVKVIGAYEYDLIGEIV